MHEDHWDLDTIKLLNRTTNFYAPDMIVNGVIVRQLTEMGFQNIHIKALLLAINKEELLLKMMISAYV